MDTKRKLNIYHPGPPSNRWRRLEWAENAPVRSASGKAVFKSLAVHADASGVAWPALGKLAAWNSLSKRQVRRALRDLELAGWIETVKRDGTSSVFHLRSPAGGGHHVRGGADKHLTPDMVSGRTPCPPELKEDYWTGTCPDGAYCWMLKRGVEHRASGGRCCPSCGIET